MKKNRGNNSCGTMTQNRSGQSMLPILLTAAAIMTTLIIATSGLTNGARSAKTAQVSVETDMLTNAVYQVINSQAACSSMIQNGDNSSVLSVHTPLPFPSNYAPVYHFANGLTFDNAGTEPFLSYSSHINSLVIPAPSNNPNSLRLDPTGFINYGVQPTSGTSNFAGTTCYLMNLHVEPQSPGSVYGTTTHQFDFPIYIGVPTSGALANTIQACQGASAGNPCVATNPVVVPSPNPTCATAGNPVTIGWTPSANVAYVTLVGPGYSLTTLTATSASVTPPLPSAASYAYTLTPYTSAGTAGSPTSIIVYTDTAPAAPLSESITSASLMSWAGDPNTSFMSVYPYPGPSLGASVTLLPVPTPSPFAVFTFTPSNSCGAAGPSAFATYSPIPSPSPTASPSPTTSPSASPTASPSTSPSPGGGSASPSPSPSPSPVDGVCGSSNGTSAPTAPSTNYCADGTVPIVTDTSGAGTGPWTWNCPGSNGGATSPLCTASSSASPSPSPSSATCLADGSMCDAHGRILDCQYLPPPGACSTCCSGGGTPNCTLNPAAAGCPVLSGSTCAESEADYRTCNVTASASPSPSASASGSLLAHGATCAYHFITVVANTCQGTENVCRPGYANPTSTSPTTSNLTFTNVTSVVGCPQPPDGCYLGSLPPTVSASLAYQTPGNCDQCPSGYTDSFSFSGFGFFSTERAVNCN
jgi:hypothetical protein